jgi:hypothetical protein
MLDHRSPDSATSHLLSGVHGLDLCVAPIELLQRSDCEELTFKAEAEERDGRIHEAVDVKSMDVLGRAVRMGEPKVALQQLANVFSSRVIDRDLAVRHGGNLRDQNPTVRFAAAWAARQSVDTLCLRRPGIITVSAKVTLGRKTDADARCGDSLGTRSLRSGRSRTGRSLAG